MKQSNIIAIGGAYVDINYTQFPFDERGLLPETETVGRHYEIVPGGSAVNFARLCSSLNLPITFIGKVGDDPMGALLGSMLRQAGINPQLIVSSDVDTNISSNMANASGHTIMTVGGSANQSLTANEVFAQVASQLPKASLLYIGGCFKLRALMPAFMQLAQEAKNHKVPLIIDHGRLNNSVTQADKTAVKQLVSQADYYLPSADEFRELWEVSSIQEGLQQLKQQTSATIVVKDGGNGALSLSNDTLILVPVFPVKVTHTVGAGDSFNAGFIAGQQQGLNLEASIRFGCATAALKISQANLPSHADVVSFLAQHAKAI